MDNKYRVTRRLKSFPIETVKETSKQFNKSFHSKVFTLFASSESMMYTYAQLHKIHYKYGFTLLKEGDGPWYMDSSDLIKVRDWILKELKKGPNPILKIYNQWKIYWDNYKLLTKKLDHLKLRKLNNLELYKIFKQFYNQYLLVGSIAYICDSFISTGENDWLEAVLSKELEKEGINHVEQLGIIRVLTSPLHLSFTLQSEYELLKLASRIIEKHSKIPSFQYLKGHYNHLSKKLISHEKNFHWINNNYHNVEYLDAVHFYEWIINIDKEAVRKNTTIQKMLNEKEKEFRKFRSSRDKLLKSLQLSDYTRNLLKIAILFSKWKDIRKSGVYIGMHYFDRFLEEISNRTKYTKEQLSFSVFTEINLILFGKKDFSEEFKKRKQQVFFVVTEKGYYIASEKDSKKYFRCHKSTVGTIDEIKGVIACSGNAKGKVRVIKRTSDMKNFKQGEILVTNQTTPEFLPIMKKAAAIVTEQGGITSHAAIISRELKKPCIIGTKIATKALRNGETVEVDAHNGIIRKER